MARWSIQQAARAGEQLTVYEAASGFEAELIAELGSAVHALGEGLVAAPGVARNLVWAQNAWLAPELIAIESIGDAAQKLRVRARNWLLHPLRQVRRSRLIEARLPAVRPKPLVFPEPPPASMLGEWALLSRDTMLASASTASPFPHGMPRFVEDRQGPPSRAYLKLWEAWTRMGCHPRAGELCLDLGASPGSWSWALARLGARVISVDKAGLDPRIAALPQVEFIESSAFALDPKALGKLDWLLSDVACYPRRLLSLVERWLAAGSCRRMICTIKLQGQTDHQAVARFQAIAGSRLVHLGHNKHELTWMLA